MAIGVFANAFLSYGPGPAWLRWGFGLGLVVWALVLWMRVRSQGSDPLTAEILPLPSARWVLLLSVLLLTLRFWRVGSFPLWPNPDEAQNLYFAQRFIEKTDLRLFWGFGDAPAWLVGCMAGFWRLTGDWGISLWLPSAVVSVITVAAVVLASRQFLSRSLTVLLAVLVAFSYWPLFMGRVGHQGVLLPLWTCGVFWTLGRYRLAASGRRGWGFLAGLTAGVGWAVFTPWPVVTFAAIGMYVLMSRRRTSDLLAFGVGSLLSLGPFLRVVLAGGWGRHVASVSSFSGWTSAGEVVRASLSYATGLLWKPVETGVIYGANHGGLLNPLLAAFFLAGTAVVWKRRRDAVARWTLFAFPIFLLPGFLSMNVEYFRVAQVMPLLLFVTAIGVSAFLGTLPSARRVPVAFLLLVLSAGWDSWRIVEPIVGFPQDTRGFRAQSRNVDGYAAHRALEGLSRGKGKGWVLDLYTPDFADPSLEACTRGMDASLDPRSGENRPAWVAVLADADSLGHLRTRFPKARWSVPGAGMEGGGDLLLGWIEPSPEEGAVLTKWREAYRLLREADRGYLYLPSGAPPGGVFEAMEDARATCEADPFLGSVYWEKVGEYHYQMTRDLDAHLAALRKAASFPSGRFGVHLKLGALLLRKGELGAAKRVLAEALKMKPGSPEVLEMLGYIEGRQ